MLKEYEDKQLESKAYEVKYQIYKYSSVFLCGIIICVSIICLGLYFGIIKQDLTFNDVVMYGIFSMFYSLVSYAVLDSFFSFYDRYNPILKSMKETEFKNIHYSTYMYIKMLGADNTKEINHIALDYVLRKFNKKMFL